MTRYLSAFVLLLASFCSFAGTATITWTAPVDGPPVAGYNLYWGYEPGVYGTSPFVVGKVLTATLANITEGGPVYFAIKSRDANGKLSANFSNEVTGNFESYPRPNPPIASPPVLVPQN